MNKVAGYEKEIIFIATISEIHKFYGQPLISFVTQHKALIEKYLDIKKLVDIIEQRNKEADEIIARAKQLALCEMHKTKTGNGGQLKSVFSRIHVKEETCKENAASYGITPLDVNTIFPSVEEKEIKEEYSNQRQGFEAELEKLKINSPTSFEDFQVVFDTILRKYLWCIPATDDEEEDIALYDYLKLTGAIASCLVQTYKEEIVPKQAFHLVGGTFSGIQSYIFAVSHMGTNGIAKRLRARSFYVDSLITVLAHYICHSFKVSMMNILMLTGGKFYILLPHTKDSETLLKQISCKMTQFFFEKFKGQINVNLEWETIGVEGLENYTQTITILSRKLSERKNKPFNDVLVKDGHWQKEQFIIYNALANKTLCKSCGQVLIDQVVIEGDAENQGICSYCEEQTQMGKALTGVREIIYSRNQGEYCLFEDYYISFNRDSGLSDIYLIEKLSSFTFSEEEYQKPIAVKYMANHMPSNEDGEPLSFADIAQASTGIKKLGVLKADVDTLGYLFSDGLRQKDKHLGTISRVATMSRMLQMFFTGYIEELINQKYPLVYSVFSGGDDLFLIGPWQLMPKLALEIQKNFKKFVAENECMTLSAAVLLDEPKKHIAYLAEKSEEKLKKVKNETVKELYDNKEGRNGIYFMEELLSWEDLEDQLQKGESLAKAIVQGVDVSLIKRIMNYSQMYQKFLKTKDVMQLMFAPLFYNDRNRNYQHIMKNSKIEEFKWFIDYANKLYENAANYKVVKKDLYFARLCVNYALNLTKEVRSHAAEK